MTHHLRVHALACDGRTEAGQDLVVTTPLPAACAAGSVAFDIGTGTGVLAAVLARRGIERVVATVEAYNRAVRPGTFDHTIQDDCRTDGLTPPKTHWAQRIDTPPFYGYPLRPGLTFTYYGVRIDRRAAVILKDGRPAGNIFAAGEIMAGNVLPKGYIGGFGLVIGNIFGRIAGGEAAALARGAAQSKAA